MLGLKGSKLAKWKVGLFQFLLLLLLSFIFIIPVTASPGWWNSSWQYKRPINISNTAGDLTGYQVKVELTILNVQSYPTLGGNWTVRFNTTGTANLTISAVNGTTWSLDGNKTDLQFLEIKCGNQTLNYSWINNSVFIPDYSCNSISYETSKVLTTGKHTIQFTFGNLTKYAYNTVTSITLNSPANNTQTTDTTPDFNFTAISDINTTFSCELFIDDTGYGANDSVSNNTATIITANSSLSDGTYNWYINCTDVNGTSKSEERVITIDTTNPTTNATAVNEDNSDYTFDTWTNSSYVNVTLNCSDSGSGCDITQYCNDITNNCIPEWWNSSWDYRRPINITGYNFTTTGTNSTLLEVNVNSLAHFIQIHDLNNQSSEYTNLTVKYQNDTATADATVYVNSHQLGTLPLTQDTYTFTNVSQSWLTEANPVNITYSSTGSINITQSSLLYFVNLSNYQVGLSVPYDSDMQLDYDDLRFTYLNDTTEQEIPYWIEKNTEIVENSTQLDTTTSASHFVSVTNWIPSGNATLTTTYLNDSMSGTTTVYVEGNSLGTLPLTTDSYTFTNVSQSWLTSSTNITYSTNGTANITESSLEYYINKSKTWVKVPFIEANSQETLYMYYGNPSASSASNGTNTFEFFDDFEDGDYTDKWTVDNGTWTEESGVLKQTDAANTDTWHDGIKVSSPPTLGERIMRCKIKIITAADSYAAYSLKWSDSNNFLHSELRNINTDDVRGLAFIDGASETTHDFGFEILEDTWYELITKIDADGNVTFIADGETFTFSDVNWDQLWEGINLHTYETEAHFDDIYVRKYADPEPATTIGSEETSNFQITTEGTSYIRFRSKDIAGNLEETKNETIKIDTAPPEIQFVPPTTETGNYSKDWIVANVTASDSGAELDTINLTLWNSTGGLVQYNTSDISPLFINFTTLPDDTYYLNATVNDTTGKTNKTETRTILLDTTEPNMSWEYPTPENNSYKTENYTEINLTIDEPNLDSFKFNWYNGTNWTNSSFYDSNFVLGMNLNNNSDIGETSTKAVDISKYENNGTIVKPSDWWNESFKYRKKLTITNNNATNLTIGKPINFTLDTASLVSTGKLLANGDDLRIVCGGDEVNRTNTSSFNSTTEIWFKSCVQINAGEDSGDNFYAYYGNSEAGTPNTGGITTEQNYNLTVDKGGESVIRAQYVDGRFGKALSFDGVDDYVEVPDDPILDINSSYSETAWVYPSSTSGKNDITMKDSSQWAFGFQVRDGQLRAGFEDESDANFIGSGGTVNTNEWQFLTVIYNGTDVIGYINGERVLGTDGGGTPCTNGEPLTIGKGEDYFNGTIDEVRVYNRSLSPEEIQMHYQSEFSKYNSSEWRFYDNLSVENQTHKFNVWANDTLGWSSENEIIVHTNTISISNLSFEDSETKHEFNISANATHTGGVDKFTGCRIYCSNCSSGSYTGNLNKTESPARCNLLINESDMDLGKTANFNISFIDSYGKERFSNTEEHSLPNVAPEISSFSITNCSEGHCFNVFANATDLNGATDISSCTIHYYNPTDPGVGWNFFPGTLSCGSNSCNCTEQISNSTTDLGNDIENEIEVYVEFEDSSRATNTTSHYNNTIINHEPTVSAGASAISGEHAFNLTASVSDPDSDSLTCKAYLNDTSSVSSCEVNMSGPVSGDCYLKVNTSTCSNFSVNDWLDSVVEVADTWDKTNSSSVSQRIPNRVPGVPTNLNLPINDSFNDSTHVVTNHPLINWTNPADPENDTINITAAVGATQNPTAEDNSVTVPNNSMKLGYGINLIDGETYYFRIKSCDSWDCSDYLGNESNNFTMNSEPTISGAGLNQTSGLKAGTIVHLKANITDEQEDSIEWANWTLKENGIIKNSTSGTPINNLNGTKNGTIWKSPNFNITGGATYNWTLITSDSFENSTTSGSFEAENSAPTITQNPLFEDYSGHKFRANATAEDPDPDDIDSCTVLLDDGESSNTTSGILKQIDTNKYLCEYNVSLETNKNFTVLEQILVSVKFSDGKATATTSTKTHNIPNRIPTKPTNINLDVQNSSRVIDHNPTLEWTKGSDDDGDNITTYVYVDEGNCSAIDPTTEENSTSGNSTEIGATLYLTDGKTYCLRARSYDSYEYGYYSDEEEFYMNSEPAINSVMTEPEAENIDQPMEINLTANITDLDIYNFSDTIIWANFTVKSGGKIVNNTNGTSINNLNGTKDGDLWRVSFNASPSTNYEYNVTTSDGYETKTRTGSFTTGNQNPSADGPYFSDNQTRHAFIAWANATDSDGNITNCTIHFDNLTESWNFENSSVNCSKEINTSHFDVGVSISIYFVFEDNANATVTTQTLSHKIPNRVPTKPTNINLEVQNSSRVIDHNPTLKWTKGSDDENDTVKTKIYVENSSNPTTLETEVDGNSTTIGNTVQLSDGQTYYYKLCSADNWSSNCSEIYNFTMNSKPTIQSAQLNNTGTLHGGDIVHLEANITDAELDKIVFANFTVRTGKGIVNSTENVSIENLNGTKNGIWKSADFELEPGLTYNWNITTSDSFETAETSGSFTVANAQPTIGQSIKFYDLGNHTFKANASVNDADADNIESCTIYMDDGESSNTTSGILKQIDSNNYLCEYNISPETNSEFKVSDLITVKITFTDYGGASVSTSDSHQIPNQKPNITAIWITPSNPNTKTDLVGNRNASDPEEDTLSNNTFDWYLNGAKGETTVEGILPQVNTKKGENWSVCLQVVDQYNAVSDEKCSGNVTIRNYPPDLSDISVTKYAGHRILTSTIATDYDNETDFKNCTLYYFDQTNQSNKTGVLEIDYGTDLEAKCSENITAGDWIIPNHKINITIEVCDGNLTNGLSNPGNCSNITTENVVVPNVVPEISLTSPENNKNSTNKTIKFMWIGSDADSDNLTYNLTIYNRTTDLINEINTTNESYTTNLLDGIYYWNVSVTDLFDGTELNTTNSETRKLTIDTTPPELINASCNITTENRTEENATNRTINATQGDNITCRFEFRDNSQSWGIGGLNNATLNISYESKENEARNLNFSENKTEFNLTNLPAGFTVLNLTSYDWLGNNNRTKINITVTDIENPNITSISHSPTSLADLDPEVNITLSAKITDNLGVDKVLLYYRRNDSLNPTNWSSTEMNLSSGNNRNGTYEIELENWTKGNWTYYIWTNDSYRNEINSSEQNLTGLLQVWKDYTISVDISGVPEIAIINQNFTIGTVNFNNTGDFNYTCALPNSTSIKVTPTGSIGNFSFDSSSVDLEPAETKTREINATGKKLGIASIEIPVDCSCLNCTENNSDYTTTINLEPEINIIAPGPYFELTGTSKIEKVKAGDSTDLIVGIKNIGNETGINLSIFLTTPSGFSVKPARRNISSFSCESGENYKTYSYTISVSERVKTGNYLLHLNTNCSNCEYTQTFKLPKIPVENPRIEEVTEKVPTGGEAAPTPAPTGLTIEQKKKLMQTEETLEVVRKEQENFTLTVENIFDGPMEDVHVNVSGYLSQYLSLVPDSVDFIPVNESYDFTVQIIAPKYFTRGTYYLNFTINATINETTIKNNITKKKLTDLKENRLVTLIIHEISKAEAEKNLNKSKEVLEEFNKSNFYSKEIEESIKEMKEAIENKNYIKTKNTIEKILDTKEKAHKADRGMAKIEGLIQKAEKREIKVEKTKRLLNLAKAAFARGDYATSLSRTQEARLTYAAETKGEFSISYFIKENWGKLGILTAVLILLSIGIFFELKLSRIKLKLKNLKKEETILIGLMKEAQKECFELKKLSMNEYTTTMNQYEKKLSRVVSSIIEYETKKANIFRFGGVEKALRQERNRLLKLISEMQKAYLEKGELETRIYKDRLKSYAKRFSEIQEKITTLEAEKEIRRKTGIKNKFRKFVAGILSRRPRLWTELKKRKELEKQGKEKKRGIKLAERFRNFEGKRKELKEKAKKLKKSIFRRWFKK